MDKIKVYIVDGVRYNVGANREQEFLTKFPNATFVEEKQKETEGKTKAVAETGASAAAQQTQAPSTELQLEKPSSALSYEIPEKLQITEEQKEIARQKYIDEVNAGPIEESKTMSFKEYRESGLMKPEEEKFYIGSGTKRVTITRNLYDDFIKEAKKQVDPTDENAVIEKAKALYVENKLEEDKFKVVEDYLRDKAGIFSDSERTFRGIQAQKITELQQQLEADIEKNYKPYAELNDELKKVVEKAKALQNANYTNPEDYAAAKKLFAQYRETAEVLTKAVTKRHDAIMSSQKTYADNAQFLDIFKREYSDAMVGIGGAVATGSALIGGALKIPEWITVAAAETFGKGGETRAAWKLIDPKARFANQLIDFSENVRGKVARPLDVSEINSLSDAASWSADLVGNQIPVIGTLVATGGAGLAVISASQAGQKYEDMMKEVDSGLADYNAAQLLFAPMAVAAGEYISERFTLGQLKGVKQVFKKSPDILKESKKYIQENIMKPKLAVDIAGESLSEGFATLNENATDIFLLDKEKSIWEGVPNSLVSGAFMSGVIFKAPVIGARLIRPFNDMEQINAQLNSNIGQIARIQEALDNQDLDEEVKQSLRSSMDAIFKNNVEIIAKTYNDATNFTQEEKDKLIDIDARIAKVKSDAKILMEFADSEVEARNALEPLNKEFNKLKREKGQIIKDSQLRNSNYGDLTKEQVEEEFNKDISRLKKLANQIGFVALDPFENSQKAIEWLNENTNLPKDKIVEYANESYGFFVRDKNTGKQTAIVIKDIALNGNETVLTTGLHEGFHAFLFNVTRANPRFAIDVGVKLRDFLMDNIEDDIFVNTRFYKRYKEYEKEWRAGNMKAQTFIEEVFPLLAEEIENGNIKYKETFFTKLGDVLRRIMQNLGMRVKLETGRDVFNFVKDYNRSFKLGRLTTAQKRFAAGQQQISDADLAQEVKRSKVTEEENEKLRTLFETNRNKFLRDERLQKLIGGVANSITKKYFDPIPDELKGPITREEFALTAETELTLIANEWNPDKQDIGKFLANRGFVRLSNLAAREFGIEQSIERGGAGFKADFETSKEAQAMTSEGLDIAPAEKIVKKTTLSDALPVEQTFNDVPIKQIVEQRLERIVRLATKKINAEISNNVTVTPFVKQVKEDLAEDLQDAMISMFMNYPGGLSKFLQDKKKPILLNLTTTYLSRHPLFKKGIQKSVGGKRIFDNQGRKTIEPNWISPVEVGPNTYDFRDGRGQKYSRTAFDRKSGIGTGMTSGPQLIRRNPDIEKVITDNEFVGQYFRDAKRQFVYDEGLTALAKQLAAEYGFEVLANDLKAKGPIYQNLLETAEVLEIAINSTIANDLEKDIQRGDIKLSKKAKDIIESESLTEDLYTLVAAHTIAPTSNLTYAVQTTLFEDIEGDDAVEMHEVLKRSIQEKADEMPKGEALTDISRLDQMLFDKKGIPLEDMGEATAAILYGEKLANKLRLFVPPNADDFMGLMYYMLRKGKTGEEDLQWIKQNIIDPYSRGIAAFNTYKEDTMSKYRKFKKQLRPSKIKLKETNSSGYTNEQSVRLYLWSFLKDENGSPISVPGISKEEMAKAVSAVRNNKELLKFAIQLKYLTPEGYPMPTEDWYAKNITIDILEDINERSRKEFLQEFIVKSEEAFGKIDNAGKLRGPMANKLLAAFGKNYVESLGDILYRMRVGRSRKFGSDRDVSRFDQWINNSVGTIMFLNTRSAFLQFISFINYINYQDNNPIQAIAAASDIKQYVKDVIFILNSDLLKQRRSGLQIDVNVDEIAQIAEKGGNTPRAILAAILKKGFVMTQYADSMAISLGGAAFYRNRMNTYLKQGFSEQEASDKAFLDFQEVTEESQQSSRPDRLSKLQAGPLGRLVFAFGNTPMQYARLTKKAALDIINGRGDWRVNAGKVLYYGAIQNAIFTSLQSALFSLAFDDEDDEEKDNEKIFNAVNSMVDTLLRGSGLPGVIASVGKNVLLEVADQAKSERTNYERAVNTVLQLSPPVQSKMSKLWSAARIATWKQERKRMQTEGWKISNPAYEVFGKTLSATLNVPADRVIEKLNNYRLAYFEPETEMWQRIFLALGYKEYQLGINETKKATNKTTGDFFKTSKSFFK